MTSQSEPQSWHSRDVLRLLRLNGFESGGCTECIVWNDNSGAGTPIARSLLTAKTWQVGECWTSVSEALKWQNSFVTYVQVQRPCVWTCFWEGWGTAGEDEEGNGILVIGGLVHRSLLSRSIFVIE